MVACRFRITLVNNIVNFFTLSPFGHCRILLMYVFMCPRQLKQKQTPPSYLSSSLQLVYQKAAIYVLNYNSSELTSKVNCHFPPCYIFNGTRLHQVGLQAAITLCPYFTVLGRMYQNGTTTKYITQKMTNPLRLCSLIPHVKIS